MTHMGSAPHFARQALWVGTLVVHVGGGEGWGWPHLQLHPVPLHHGNLKGAERTLTGKV